LGVGKDRREKEKGKGGEKRRKTEDGGRPRKGLRGEANPQS